MEFRLLLQGLGEEIGLADLRPDEDGTCRLGMDDMVVDMKATGDGRHVLLFGEIAPLPQERREELVMQLLGGNFLFQGTAGAALGLDVDTHTLYLQQMESLDGLDELAFAKLLETFANTMESWKKLLSDFELQAESAPAQEEQPADEISFGLSGMNIFRA